MKSTTNMPKTTTDRRQFLKNVGGALFYISLPLGSSVLAACDDEKMRDTQVKEVNIWVQLHGNGQITIMNATNEMGQGSLTALAVLIAEELDADWSKVQIKDTPANAEIYGSPGFFGKNSMITAGSRTVMSYYDLLRQAGAQARQQLLQNVAAHWNVPISELHTEPSMVLHEKSKKKIPYGEIASFYKPIENAPEISLEQLKKPKDFRIIGKEIPRIDIPDKVNGNAKFGLDIQVPHMVYAVISRAPVNGASPTLTNEADIGAMNGVLEIITLDHGIGVIASTVEHALKAKAALQIEWSKGAKAAHHTSAKAYAEYEKTAAKKPIKEGAIVSTGNIQKAFRTAAKTYTRDYKNDYVYHAQMEPLNAVVSIAADHSSAEFWTGTQSPSRTRKMVAEMLQMELSKVTLHRQYMGGGFGRRADDDWVKEAVLLAQKSSLKRPVKLIWTREDDVTYGMFRPMSLQRMQACFDASGNITGWRHTIVGTGGRLLSSGAKTNFYTFPNQHIEVRNTDHGIRTRHWRAVGHGPNKFAIEAFIDELAFEQKKDAVDFRMQLMANHPGAQKVLQTVADMAEWGSPSVTGRAKGIAFAERSGSLSACVCELSVNRKNGNIQVHRLWASLDAGVIVQPDNAIAQMEGGLLMGLSSILKERIAIKEGAVQQSNYHDYGILRMNEIPDEVHIKLMPSNEKPTGIGESAVPIIGGAVANAFFSLTGKRLRHLPFTPDTVLDALSEKNT